MSTTSDEESVEDFLGFTVRDIRNHETAQKATVFSSEFSVKKSDKFLQGHSDSSSTTDSFTEVNQTNRDAAVSSNDDLVVPPQLSKLSQFDCRTPNEDCNTSDSEIMGYLADDVYEFTCRIDKKNKTGSALESKENAESTDSSDSKITDTQINIYSSDSTEYSNKRRCDTDTESCTTEIPPKRGKKRSTIKQPKELTEENCCPEKCLQLKLSLHQIESTRLNMVSRFPTYESQRQFMIDWFASHEYTPGDFAFDIAGIAVCYLSWISVLGITRRTFFRIKKEYKRGLRVADHGATGSTRAAIKNECVSIFLENYVKENGENMPNSQFVHLSSSITWRDIYLEMVETLRSQGQDPCSKDTFRSIRKREFSHVKIPKDNRMGKCDFCTNIKDELKMTRDSKMREKIFQMRKDHGELMRAERKCYHKRAADGHKLPHQFFSIAIDGMDQNKTELPYSKLPYKGLENATKLRVHIVGSMIHGRPPILFLDWRQHKHDSNLTMNILMQVMWINREFLPDVIYLQLDNTAKENKNQFVFSFIAYLVQIEVCERFEVCFLKPGHTHIDCDQLFSRLSVALSRLGCLTFKDLIHLIRTSYRQAGGERGEEGAVPQWASLDHLYAIKEWLLPHMKGVHNLRCFYHFAFFIENELVTMHYKQWNSEPWDPSKYPPVTILESTPTGIPSIIKPNYEAMGLNKLDGMVEKGLQIGAFKEEEIKEWKLFIQQEKEKAALYDSAEQVELEGANVEQTYLKTVGETWPIDDLVNRTRPGEPVSSLSSILEKFASKEKGDGLIEVYSGAYRKPKKTQRDVIENATMDEIDIGELVAVHCPHYKEIPQIGKVVGIDDDNIDIEWYHGNWTTAWKPVNKRCGRDMIPWTESVPKANVKLFDFTLTEHFKLRQPTVRRLKNAYGLQLSEEK